MNTLIGLAGFIASVWLCVYAFNTLDIDALGYAAIGVMLLCITLVGVGVMEDVSSYNEFKHSGEEE